MTRILKNSIKEQVWGYTPQAQPPDQRKSPETVTETSRVYWTWDLHVQIKVLERHPTMNGRQDITTIFGEGAYHLYGGCQWLSCVQLFATLWTIASQAPLSMEFSRQEYQSALPFPSPGIFLIQGSNLGLLHSRQILYCLSHLGNPPLYKGNGCQVGSSVTRTVSHQGWVQACRQLPIKSYNKRVG